ncbi:hypothetical protein AcW1_003297 [Taiwanofungus camphoratus]|nr:hypothetical protein AcW1_003297 [Antrodia cinnamomea]
MFSGSLAEQLRYVHHHRWNQFSLLAFQVRKLDIRRTPAGDAVNHRCSLISLMSMVCGFGIIDRVSMFWGRPVALSALNSSEMSVFRSARRTKLDLRLPLSPLDLHSIDEGKPRITSGRQIVAPLQDGLQMEALWRDNFDVTLGQ